MIDFTNAALVDEAQPFVMPAAESHYLTARMHEAGIELMYHSWRDVVRGNAPFDYEEALAVLRPFEEVGAFSASPCIIVSQVAPEEMLENALRMVREPRDPDYAIYTRAHATMRDVATEKPDEARCPDAGTPCSHEALEAHDAPGNVQVLRRTGFYSYWAPDRIGPDVARLAVRIVRGVASGELANGRRHFSAETSFYRRTFALLRPSIEDQLYAALHEDPHEFLKHGFASEGQAVFMLEEAVAALSLEIASWLESPYIKDRFAQFYFEVDPLDYEDPNSFQFEGVAGSVFAGRVLHMRTSSVRILLERDEGAPLGFVARHIDPDFGTPSAIPTGCNLRELASGMLHRECLGEWHSDPVTYAVMEYRCDSCRSIPVRLGSYWFSDQDFEVYAAVAVSCADPAVSRTVYLTRGGTFLVTSAGTSPQPFEYYPRIYLIRSGGDAEVAFLERSEGPHERLYDCSLNLGEPGMFEALRRMHPEAAETVDDLRRTIASYEAAASKLDGEPEALRPEESAGPWLPRMDAEEWRSRMAERWPGSRWEYIARPLDCPEGESALLAMTGGRDVFASRCPSYSVDDGD